MEAVVNRTLESMPAHGTHWSTRRMGKEMGLTQNAIARIWRAFGLQPRGVEPLLPAAAQALMSLAEAVDRHTELLRRQIRGTAAVPLDRKLSLSEAMEYSGLPKWCLLEWIVKGDLPCLQNGRGAVQDQPAADLSSVSRSSSKLGPRAHPVSPV
jgi:hypothetical protein